MNKLFITGAAGFIGYHTALRYLNEGYEVVALDNMNDYYDPILKHFRLNNLKSFDNFEFIKGDVEDKELLEKIFSENKFELILNLAARAGVRYSTENPYVYFSTNTIGLLNILELMRKYDINKLLLASTSSVYAGSKIPFVENQITDKPISPYSASKLSAELLSFTYHHLYEFDIGILRFFTVFGPAGRPDMSYFRFIKWIDEGSPLTIYGDGTQGRDFTFINDIVNGIYLASQKHLGYEIMNLGNSSPVSINEMIGILEDILGKKAIRNEKEFISSDMMNTYSNINKAKIILGWEPEVDLRRGLEICVKWYKDNKELLKKLDKGYKV